MSAVVGAVGENKLMPVADCSCKVINGRSGHVRDNSSWVIGRIVRDFENWMDHGEAEPHVRKCVEKLIDGRGKEKNTGKAQVGVRAVKVGLCVSVYKAKRARPGHSGRDLVYFSGFATGIVQLGLAAIPFGLFGDWSILLVAAAGILLSFATGALPQWKGEKWACRTETTKTVVLTRGNGSQHAIVIIGDGKGLDLEDLATAPTMSTPSRQTKLATTTLAVLWIFLLVTAAGIRQNTWFLFTIGGIGILQNIYVAGASRLPQDFGIPLEFVEVIGEPKVMNALYKVEERYPRVGRSMLTTYFPGELRQDEKDRWQGYEVAQKEKAETRPGV